MKRPRDKSFINDPRASAFMAVFGVFFLWAAYHTLESQKITRGRILYTLLLCWVALCSFAPLLVQLTVAVKKKRKEMAVEAPKVK